MKAFPSTLEASFFFLRQKLTIPHKMLSSFFGVHVPRQKRTDSGMWSFTYEDDVRTKPVSPVKYYFILMQWIPRFKSAKDKSVRDFKSGQIGMSRLC